MLTRLRHLVREAVGDDEGGDLNRLVQNAAKILSSNTVVTGLQFVQVIVLARFLSIGGYGAYAAMLAFVEGVNQFFDVRIAETATRYGSEYRAASDVPRMAATFKLAYLINLTTGTLAFLIVSGLAGWASVHILHNGDLREGIQLLAVGLLVSSANNTASSILRVMDRFGWMALYSGASAFIELIAVTVVLSMGGGLMGLLICLIAKRAVATIAAVYLASRALLPTVTLAGVVHAPLGLLHSRASELRTFILSTNFIAYARMITTKCDVLILAYFRSPVEVGVYKVGLQLASAIVRITDPLVVTVLPDLTQLAARREYLRFRQLVVRASILAAALLLPLATAIVLFREQIILGLFGETFLPAGQVIAVAIWGFVIAGTFFWLWPAFLGLGRPEIGVWTAGPGAILHLCLMIGLTPVYGAVGIASSYVVTQLIVHVILVAVFVRTVRNSQLQKRYQDELLVLSR